MNYAEVVKKIDTADKEYVQEVLNDILDVYGEDFVASGIIKEDNFADWIMMKYPNTEGDSIGDMHDDSEMVAEYLMDTDMDSLKDVLYEMIDAFGDTI